MTTLILQGAQLTSKATNHIARELSAEIIIKSNYVILQTGKKINHSWIEGLRQQYPFDINQIPAIFDARKTRLLVTDMDSTLIGIECVDEIADYINVKPQVAEITEAAMRGEIDFETSLRQRVSLLKGLDVDTLEQVYNERLVLNPGAEKMLKALKQSGIKTALVSGGFTFFTERLKQRLGLDFTLANVLGEKNGKLTGEVVGEICGARSKADFLLQQCDNLNINSSQTVAMGDGANDLLMMNEAGLSIAYHAKPTVQQQADTVINHCGLEGVIGLLQI